MINIHKSVNIVGYIFSYFIETRNEISVGIYFSMGAGISMSISIAVFNFGLFIKPTIKHNE